jgi:5-formyltetrahydrofolate cyclo-ligase
MPSDHHGFIPSSAEDLLRRRVKAELRKRMRGVRAAMPAAACAARSTRIVERLEAIEAIARARTVSLFWPIEDRHEVDLRALDASLRARGVRVAYPRIDRDSGGMAFRFVEDPSAMQVEGYLREPSPDAPEAEALDAIVVPALAVDPRGHRVGYGAGYYDRALARMHPPAIAAIVAFDFQLVAEVPTTESDVACDFVVTDTRTLTAEP